MKIIKTLGKISTQLIRIMCVVLFLALTLTMVLMILSRNVSFINFDVMWTDEISRYLFVYVVFLGSGLAMIEGKHIRLDFLLDKFSPKVRVVVDTFNDIVTMLFCFVMISGGYTLVQKTGNQAVATLRKYFIMPMSWWNSAILVCGVIMFISVAVSMIKEWAGKEQVKSDDSYDSL